MSGADTYTVATDWFGPTVILDHDGKQVGPMLPCGSGALFAASHEMLAALDCGVRMRAAQARYFRDRSRENLIDSKGLEREFDLLARAAIAKAEGRQS